MKKKLLLLISLMVVFVVTITCCFVYFFSNFAVIKQNLDYSENVNHYLNPDQGFYRTACIAVTPDSVEDKSYIIKDDFQLYHLRMDLSSFSHVANLNQDLLITPNAISQMENLINKFFEKDKNIILRFSYDKNFNGLANQEPNEEIVYKHIEQICEILNKFPYTITAVEAGMVGPWGEMHSSTIATPKVISNIIDTFLNNTNNIPILVRTPKMIYDYLGITIENLNSYKIPTNSPAYRLGVFNDGFLGSSTDLGTYQNRQKEILWLSNQTSHLPFGGEVTRPNSSLHNIENCLEEMNLINLSYLNYEWDNEIVQGQWQSQKYNKSCGNNSLYYGKSAYEYIRNHMGYRFILKDSTFSYNKKMNNLIIDLSLENVGFGQLCRTKDISVLFIKNNVVKKTFSCGSFSGQNKIRINLNVAELSGNYSVYLTLNNEQNGVNCYSLKFSNNLWNENLKSNKIGQINI